MVISFLDRHLKEKQGRRRSEGVVCVFLGRHFGDQNLRFILVISCTFIFEFLRLLLCNHGAIVVEFAGILEKLSARIQHKSFPQKQHVLYKKNLCHLFWYQFG